MAILRKLNDEHHVVRYIKASNLNLDQNGKALGVLPQAFELRQNETDLSTSWREYFPGTRLDQLRCIKVSTKLTVTPKAGFGSLKVSDAHAACKATNVKVRIVHSPKQGEPAHSSILQMPTNGDALRALWANLASGDLEQARDL